MVRIGAIATALAAAGLVVGFSSQAQTNTFTSATALLNDYNLIVLGNATENSEVDGKVFIGGSLSGSGNFDTHTVDTATTAPSLTVGGTVTATNMNLNGDGGLIAGSLSSASLNNNGNGNIYVNGNISFTNLTAQNGVNIYATGNLIGSSVSVNNAGNGLYLGGTAQSGVNSKNQTVKSTVSVNGAGVYQQNSKVPATVVPNVTTETSEAKTALTNYSTQLSNLAANNSVTDSNSTLDFNVTKTTNGVAVFDINSATAAALLKNSKATTASLLNGVSQMEFSLNGAKEVVINVSGVGSTALNIDANFLNGVAQSLGTDTVWNFTDATTIKIGAQFGGDVLATMANLTTSGNVEGTVVAKSIVQGAEIHYDGTQSHLVSAVPLPGAALLFGSAITGVGLFSRRRRKTAR
jgi:choice-of-anchor A domain-containing protein